VFQQNPGSIHINNVSKVFKKASGTSATYSTLKSFLVQNIKGIKSPKKDQQTSERYKALDSISLDLPPGSSTALIGRNGSGKSTILKLIAGIYTPDTGTISVHGKVSALIELGAGFHPDFTGRENIFLGGIMFGLSKKEIRKRFDEIVAYAELAHVIDEPVRTYSSGMYMRLGFSLAIHTDPDILLVDEVLAVGDAHFIHRCQDSISEFKRKGKTLVFVTHDLSSVSKWCDEAVWLDKGKIRLQGHPREISDAYLSSVHDQEEKELEALEIHSNQMEQEILAEEGTPSDLDTKRWGNGKVKINKVTLLDTHQHAQWIFSEEDSVLIRIYYQAGSNPKDLVFGVGIIRIDGVEVFGTNTAMNSDLQKNLLSMLESIHTSAEKGSFEGYVDFTIDRLGLTEGTYFVDVAAHAEDGTPYDYHHRMHKFQVRKKHGAAVGIISPKTSWDISSLLQNTLTHSHGGTP
jgi:lipopolysaccharide transport system ATP-binding protein